MWPPALHEELVCWQAQYVGDSVSNDWSELLAHVPVYRVFSFATLKKRKKKQ
jgi:hypothetical protein